MSTLPLKALSRLWGRFNELTLPYYLRVPGIKLYSYVFGVKCVIFRDVNPVFLFQHWDCLDSQQLTNNLAFTTV